MSALPIPIAASELPRGDSAALRRMFGHIRAAGEEYAQAARIWAEFGEESRALILERSPSFMRATFARLDRVAAGTLLPQLVAAQNHAVDYLGRLPVAEQERYLAERIPVAVKDGRGWDVAALDVGDLSREQRMQVFEARGGAVRVRTPDEQKAWRREFERKRQEREAADAGRRTRIERKNWTMEDGRVWPDPKFAAKGFTKSDLRAMLRDLNL